MDFTERALKFLEMKSVSEEGNEEAINFLIPQFEQIGAKLVLQQVPHSLKDHSKRQYNLLAVLGDDLVDSRTKKGLLLVAPVDTCNPGNPADWTELKGNVFAPQIKNGSIYGLGAANSKLNFLAMLRATEAFAKKDLVQPIYLAATCGGESVLAGARYLIQSGAVNPKRVIVGRPTSLKLQNHEKTQITFQLKISFVSIERDAQEFNAKVFISSKSKGIHVAHADAKKNALENVLFFLENLKASPVENKLISLQGANSMNHMPDTASAGIVIKSKDLDVIRDRFRSISANNRDCLFEMRLGGTGDRGVRLLSEEVYQAIRMLRAELGVINEAMAPVRDEAFAPEQSFGVLSGVVQERDALVLSVQFYLIPEFASVENKKEIEQDFKNRVIAIARNFQSISIDCRRTFSTSRFFTDPESTFANTLKADMQRVGLNPSFTAGNCATEAALFAEKGYEAIAFGAGDSVKGTNCPNEKVSLEDLDAAVRFYSGAIEAFCVRGI